MEFNSHLIRSAHHMALDFESFAVPTGLSLASDGLQRNPEFGNRFAIKL
jgi:hypothetical protein